MIKIAPSILAADFSRLAEEIVEADQAGADLFHLDIMDGHFVPNISFGPSIVRTIDNLTTSFLDVHLMLSEPEKYFEPFAKAGADNITFHIEARPDPKPLLDQLKSMGVKAGLSLNPDTPVEHVLPFLGQCDYLLVMSVFPGFGGQSFIEPTLKTIETVRNCIDKNSFATLIEVDGGVDSSNAEQIVQAGADVLIMGTAFFSNPDWPGLVRNVKKLKRKRVAS